MKHRLYFTPMNQEGLSHINLPNNMIKPDITHAIVKFEKNDGLGRVKILFMKCENLDASQASYASEIHSDPLSGTAPSFTVFASTVDMWVSSRMQVLGTLQPFDGVEGMLIYEAEISPIMAECLCVLDDKPSLPDTHVEEAHGEDTKQEQVAHHSTHYAPVQHEADDLEFDECVPSFSDDVPMENEDDTVTVHEDSQAESNEPNHESNPVHHDLGSTIHLTLHPISKAKRGDDTELSIKVMVDGFPDDHTHYSLEFDKDAIRVYSGDRAFIKAKGKRLYKYSASGKGIFNALSDFDGEKFKEFYGIHDWIQPEQGKVQLDTVHSVTAEDTGVIAHLCIGDVSPISELVAAIEPVGDTKPAPTLAPASTEASVEPHQDIATRMPPDIASIEHIQAVATKDMDIHAIIDGLKAGAFYVTEGGVVLGRI